MGLKIYGIGACQSPDNSGETILIDNIDTSKLRYINDEHQETMFSMIGGITYHKKIHSANECTDERELRCWNHAKAPFLFFKGELASDTDHPNAQSAAALIEFCAARPDLPLQPGMSVEGGILERSGSDNKILSKTLATGLSVTVKPCHPRCALFMEGDLRKSQTSNVIPEVYIEALKKSDATSSFRENQKAVLKVYLEILEKSAADYFGGFTHLKCYHCGVGVRFFKSSRQVPNRCQRCSAPFTLNDIWKAMNR